MKKKLQLIGIAFILFVFKVSNVAAVSMEAVNDCTGTLGDPKNDGSTAWYLQQALEIMRFAGIILCVVLTVVEIFKSILNDEKADLKPIVSKAGKRLVYVVLLFFLPSLVNVIMSFVGAYSTCGIK